MSRPALVFRVALSALAMAEYFRDEKNQDVLLFIDNIFRFSQAGSEVSALLGPHAERGRLPADARGGNGRLAGAHHFDEQRFGHVIPGRLCPGGRLDRPGAGEHVRALGFDHRVRAVDRRTGHLSRPSIRCPRPRGALAGDRWRGAL